MRKHTSEEVVLDNGSRGLLVHVPGAPVMNYEINFRAGEYLTEDPKKWETAHLLEHVILGANKRYPEAKKFSAEFQKNGAYSNAYTGYYSIGYIGETADFEWQRVLKLQLLSLKDPLFLPREFKAEWGNIHDELISLHNQHFRHLNERLNQDFGFKHPTSRERAELMHNVTRNDLIEHYKRTHTTSNMRFMVVGNLRGRKTKIIELFNNCGLELGQRFELPKESARKPKKPTFVENDTVDNIYFYIQSYRNSEISDTEGTALALVRMMLTDTLHSKIYGSAREKGLVYSVHSSHGRMSNMSEWWLSAQVLPENAPALCDIIINEVNKVKIGRVTEADLKAVKKYALGNYQRSLQTVGSIAGSYSRYFFDGEIEDLNQVPARIKAVTKHDMAEAMKSLFAENIGSIGVLGGADQSVVEKLNKQLSPLWS